MARTSFEAVDDDLAAHRIKAKRYSPWPICALVILGVITFSLMWYLSKTSIGVTPDPTVQVVPAE